MVLINGFNCLVWARDWLGERAFDREVNLAGVSHGAVAAVSGLRLPRMPHLETLIRISQAEYLYTVGILQRRVHQRLAGRLD